MDTLGLRIVGEMTWIFSNLSDLEKLIEYESKINYFFPKSQISAICQYNEKKFNPEILLDVINTHPKVIIYNNIYENYYYIPPNEFIARFKGEVSKETYERVREDIISRSKYMEEYELSVKKLRESEKRYRLLFDNSLDGIYRSNLDGKYVDVNPALIRILGYKNKEELLSKSNTKHIYCSKEDRLSIDNINEKDRIFETCLKKKDGTKIYVEVSSKLVFDEDGDSYFGGIVRNITERRKVEKKLKYLSYHDKLTGLYNRAYFEEELKRLNKERQLPLSFIMGDTDGLKLVNETFGYKEGDKLLRNIAKILKKSCREEDIIAR